MEEDIQKLSYQSVNKNSVQKFKFSATFNNALSLLLSVVHKNPWCSLEFNLPDTDLHGVIGLVYWKFNYSNTSSLLGKPSDK